MPEEIPEFQFKDFQDIVWNYYKSFSRVLPWRITDKTGNLNPYHILISEIMLQQTQVNRVVVKYNQFLSAFPTIESLASAALSEVLVLWSGLGYNRRAKYLHEAAKQIASKPKFPETLDQLTVLPGIGINTASAILAYSFNQPVVYIETNIRTVYIHHFFKQNNIADTDIMPLVAQTLDTANPREWYWALMDYGSYLKTITANPNRRSKHHVKQSSFKGSKRQIRGQVLKQLTSGSSTVSDLETNIIDTRLKSVLLDLENEGLIHKNNQTYYLGK